MESCRSESIDDQAYGFHVFRKQATNAVSFQNVLGVLSASLGPAGHLLQLQPVRHGRLMYGDGQLGVGSGGTTCEIPAAKLVHRLRNSVVHRVCPHLDLMLNVVGIGKGDDAASGVHGVSIGEHKAK